MLRVLWIIEIKNKNNLEKKDHVNGREWELETTKLVVSTTLEAGSKKF